jgi:hypothetical protein
MSEPIYPVFGSPGSFIVAIKSVYRDDTTPITVQHCENHIEVPFPASWSTYSTIAFSPSTNTVNPNAELSVGTDEFDSSSIVFV